MNVHACATVELRPQVSLQLSVPAALWLQAQLQNYIPPAGSLPLPVEQMEPEAVLATEDPQEREWRHAIFEALKALNLPFYPT